MSKSAALTNATGKAITEAILEAMEKNLEPLYSRTIVPAVYRIQLHDTDFRRLRNILPVLRDDATDALEKTLQKWNASKLRVTRQKFEKLHDWHVEFYVDPNDKLPPGEILIEPAISREPVHEHHSGSETKRSTTVRRRIDLNGPAAIPSRDTTRTYGYFSYTDDSGTYKFTMREPEIAIGRGGAGSQVNLKLVTSVDVSRKHCIVKWDSGAFYIKDLSSNGTVINNQRVPSSMKVVNDRQQDINSWVPLPFPSEIELARKLLLRFEAARK